MTQSKSEIIEILSNEMVALDTYKIKLKASIRALPGQFINIKLNNHYLRRPISISRIYQDYFEIIYKVKGEGTKDLSLLKANDKIDILYPLGNGYTLVENKKVLLIGGGIGIPPLLELYHQLKNNNQVKLLIGLNDLSENIYSDYQPLITTINQSSAFHGNVVDYLKNNEVDYNYVYACGPMPMLKALQKYINVDGQISIEERMGCGFGACMGCSCKTKYGYKRICVEGPVFDIKELDLDDY